ncbi:type I restriction endonuclease subunit R [Methanococcus voltae]|uniref:type I site-specific deoxyribonuclease n=1 Tax=Methanococcus voltae (strain ATCC BAA-1334 / A3) TaxID=456320 RepID=D7DS67_METV3|nr:type I restriction endonuclease subunit R [Methanococcus voltae]MCS3901503.1 type I restriction enzyme R subunit [Methanococcus voltae]
MEVESESQLENKFIKQLVNQGYSRIKIEDEKDLENNFREQLYLHNKEKLDNIPFSDYEFNKIMTQLSGKSIFESAKILRDKCILERDEGNTPKKVYLEFIDSNNLNNNIFQVTNQITMKGKYENRYDVTLLINGLPLIQVELKKAGVDIKEAFNQVMRYRKHSYKGLFRYIQIFVIGSNKNVKYFANRDGEILFNSAFFWANVDNKRITNLDEFADNFLEKNRIAKIISEYMIINESDKNLMVMRPYQIYAVESILDRAINTNSNGYVWHTTGSGKTLTSFKASQLLANNPKIDRVFFLVDRKDLDAQTIKEFNKFEKDSVDDTDNTKNLVKQIQEIDRKLIVTTIQKMSIAIKSEKYAEIMDKYKDDKVIFIIDECHRSQFGEMHRVIKKHFVNAQYFGFTGTPIFKENKGAKDMVTADLFKKCLHTYLIKDAIRDGNVLGFLIQYFKTFEGNYDKNDDTKIYKINKKELWSTDERISLICNDIVKNHNLKTRDKEYCSIFAVDSIPSLIKYYNKFKEFDHDLKIAGIYTYEANEASAGINAEHSRDILERIISDYNKIYNTNYSTDTFSNYFIDISKRLKNGQIDILLVVNMFLTGFDSKLLNTIYIDKDMKYHNLIQAFSRTNRVYSANKPHGNVVCYRNLREKTENAIRLFSQTDDVDTVLMESYEFYLDKFKERLEKLHNIANTPDDVDLIEGESKTSEFVMAFKNLTKVLVTMKNFVEFEFEEDKLGIDEQTYQEYKTKYLMVYDDVTRGEYEGTSVLKDIDFSIELMYTDKINVDYILNLLKNLDIDNTKNRDKEIKDIVDKLKKADNEELRLKVELIQEFLEKEVPKIIELNNQDDIESLYYEFEDKKRTEEVEEFAKENNIDTTKLWSYVEEYDYSKTLDKKAVGDSISAPFLKKKRIINKVSEFIQYQAKKYA